MTRSMYCDSSENVPRRAYGYGIRNGRTGRVADIVHTGTYAAGAICSTAEDLITWLKALHVSAFNSPGFSIAEPSGRTRSVRRGEKRATAR